MSCTFQPFRNPVFPLMLLLAAFPLSAQAQSTWTVQAGGGPGVDFSSLQAAVDAALDGDTLLVSTSPAGVGQASFTTDKGLTILGLGGLVPLVQGNSPAVPVLVHDVPTGSAFRMAGFTRAEAGPLALRIENCFGQVHLEDLGARQANALGTVPGPNGAISISGCASVVLNRVTNTGALTPGFSLVPAVSVGGSNVLISACRLGYALDGSGTGPCLSLNNSTANLIEPDFRQGNTSGSPVVAQGSALTIAGDANAILNGDVSPTLVLLSGSSLRVDPRVQIVKTVPFGAPISTDGSVQVLVTETITALWTSKTGPGSPLTVHLSGAAGALVPWSLGTPSLLTPQPVGIAPPPLQALDFNLPVRSLPPIQLDGNGQATKTLQVPAAASLGRAIGFQPFALSPQPGLGEASVLILQ